jgi:LmbE family N-acetylglucosaminyl deacetylase
MNLLAIGGPPHDIELGFGGILSKSLKSDHNMFTYTLTKGSASGDGDERVRELRESSAILKARSMWIDDFEDTTLCLNNQLINHIENFIKKSKADIIFTHSITDNHHDHRAAAEATREASRYCPTVLSHEVPLTKKFEPHVYFDISDVIDEKLRLISVFFTQKEKDFITSDAIKGLAQYRALQSRLGSSSRFVEAFEVLKMSFGENFKLLPINAENISCMTSKSILVEDLEMDQVDIKQ